MKKIITIVAVIFLVNSCLYAESPGESSAVSDEVKLSELVVNASRTQTLLKEMTSAVTVLPESMLSNNEIYSITQASAMIPNFFMPDYGTKLTSPVYIRGMGSRINAPSVGMYVDGIPYFEKAAFDFDFFDVQKIEVLRGPQGTLFGRNSMGGLINITTRSPFDYQGTHVLVSKGNHGFGRINTGHYQLLSDKLGYSVAASFLQQDGFHTNTTLNNKADKLTSYGVRFKLQYKMTDRWSIDFSTNTDYSEQSGYPYAPFNKTTFTAGDIVYNQASGYDRMLMSNALKVNYRGKGWSFANTLSHQYLNDNQLLDQDFGADSVYFAQQRQNQHHIANEAVFQSSGNTRYQWLAGLFVFMQDVNNEIEVDYYKAPTPAGIRKMWYQMDFMPQTLGAALFHQSEYRIMPGLTLTAGLRYDYEQSELKYRYQGTLAGNNLTSVDTVYQALKEAVLLPKVAIGWAVNPGLNVYASYATGYKPGGFNTAFERPEHLMFRKETSYNLEAGVKASLFDYLFAEGALFYAMLENQQIYRTAPSGRGSYLDNSGLSRNMGFEMSISNRTFQGFEAAAAYGYTHAEILESVLNDNLNYNNKFTPYIPRHTFTAQATQSLVFPDGSLIDKLKMHVSFQQTGTLYWNLSNNLKEDGYSILNAKIALIKSNLQIDFWGKNLTNTQYNAFIFEVGPAAYAQKSKPLQIGTTITWRL
jgi:outer membrane receptor protein involved in Fe transport